MLLLLLGSRAMGQIGNLMSFDDKLLHYGIQIGYTQSKFDLDYTLDDNIREIVHGTESYYTAGFHIAIIGDLRLGRYLNLRLLPGITIINRDRHRICRTIRFEFHISRQKLFRLDSISHSDLPIERLIPLIKCKPLYLIAIAEMRDLALIAVIYHSAGVARCRASSSENNDGNTSRPDAKSHLEPFLSPTTGACTSVFVF